MERKIRDWIISIVGLTGVIIVIVSAFLFKEEIEEFSRTGYLGVFLACFASTASILLPAPGLIVILQYSMILNPIIVIILGSLGTATGELIGYFLGYTGNRLIKSPENNRILRSFNRHPVLIVFIFSAIPFPIFDIVGICAGSVKMNTFKFWLTCWLGKIIKVAIFVAFMRYIILSMGFDALSVKDIIQFFGGK